MTTPDVSVFAGKPSDAAPGVLATGRCVVTSFFVSMCARHPEGRDAEYLAWHTFDHRPEQHRLASVRGTLRLVSTPECRARRLASEAPYDDVDHVMSYFFANAAGLGEFSDLSLALRAAGRVREPLPPVERGVFRLDGTAAAARVKVGADVLLWLPIRGAYLFIERGELGASDLVEMPGVAGAWWGTTRPPATDFATPDGRPMSEVDRVQLTYLFLDDDPLEAAERIREALERRWAGGAVAPLLAGPFQVVAGHDFDRYLP